MLGNQAMQGQTKVLGEIKCAELEQPLDRRYRRTTSAAPAQLATVEDAQALQLPKMETAVLPLQKEEKTVTYKIGRKKYLRNKKRPYERYRYGAMSSRRTGVTYGHGGYYHRYGKNLHWDPHYKVFR